MKEIFSNVAMTSNNPKYDNCISRIENIYNRDNDIRTEFYRDYTRILHSTAYRRLKHKTQVFFATNNDHVCTRIEHVNHVESISYTISKYLGLNTELTSAISIGHDVGHAPFGHQGETVLKEIIKTENVDTFWHERNSLFFIDFIETLPDDLGYNKNLNLTYAVRDGIVCHCGEIDEDKIVPRDDFIDLEEIKKPNQYSSYTWEGCVVKISDKIAYLGRDIEDALTLKFLEQHDVDSLLENFQEIFSKKMLMKDLNNTNIMHNFIVDLCNNSNPDDGLKLSAKSFKFMKFIKDFNTKNIYTNEKLEPFKKYAFLMITTIYEAIVIHYQHILKEKELPKNVRSDLLRETFKTWINKYTVSSDNEIKNRKVFNLSDEKEFKKCAIYYISGMTDNFVISVFDELNSF